MAHQTKLSRFRELFVIARNTMFTFKGQAVDVGVLADQLQVRYVVEGSIRRSGEGPCAKPPVPRGNVTRFASDRLGAIGMRVRVVGDIEVPGEQRSPADAPGVD